MAWRRPAFVMNRISLYSLLGNLNPWSKAVIDRPPLHALSYAIPFVALRLLAAANNLLISACGLAPPGSLVKAVAADGAGRRAGRRDRGGLRLARGRGCAVGGPANCCPEAGEKRPRKG